jgi:hypothetical protein
MKSYVKHNYLKPPFYLYRGNNETSKTTVDRGRHASRSTSGIFGYAEFLGRNGSFLFISIWYTNLKSWSRLDDVKKVGSNWF